MEEPIEIRVNGQSLAVLMRTPGDDKALVAGFCLTEGIVDGSDDFRGLAPCTDPGRPNAGNVYNVLLAEGCMQDESRLAKAQRQFFASSSCGLCGKATIENLHQVIDPHPQCMVLDRALLERMGDRALSEQKVFHQTGGLHAAALFHAESGQLMCSAEDIGRHNAVDKVVGAMLLEDNVPLGGHVLWVSGRSSFEVVQKALVAGVSGLVCVGAPSSLAVEMAVESNLTLVGFASGGSRFNVYNGIVEEAT